MTINENLKTGETIGAVLTNAETGEKKFVGGAPTPPPEPKAARYKVEVKITDLQTGEIHKYEAERS